MSLVGIAEHDSLNELFRDTREHSEPNTIKQLADNMRFTYLLISNLDANENVTQTLA